MQKKFCYVLIAIQLVLAIFTVVYAMRNDVEEVRETGNRKVNNLLTPIKRKMVRRQIKNSNFSKQEEVYIRNPILHSPIQFLNFWDAFRSRQLKILWVLQFCTSACKTLFCVFIIHKCAEDIDKKHDFCINTMVASVCAALLAPVFGLSNDSMGVRFNSTLGMLALAGCSYGLISYDSDMESLIFLVVVFCGLVWQTITVTYACGHIFGIKCGLYCVSFVRTADMAAVALVTIEAMTSSCFTSGTCGNILIYTVLGLMILGAVLSTLLNPKPLVKESED